MFLLPHVYAGILLGAVGGLRQVRSDGTSSALPDGGTLASISSSLSTALLGSPTVVLGNVILVPVPSENVILRASVSDQLVLSFSLFAGTPGTAGLTDGPGTSALFGSPNAIAVAGSDLSIAYVADMLNNNIRSITVPGALVTTIAGSTAGYAGALDGTGTGALFTNPMYIVGDPLADVLYIADTGNFVIRSLNLASSNLVSTLAGSFGARGTVDNPAGASVQFSFPSSLTIALDPVSGTTSVLFVADETRIRSVDTTTGGTVTIAGTVPGPAFNAFGTVSNALDQVLQPIALVSVPVAVVGQPPSSTIAVLSSCNTGAVIASLSPSAATASLMTPDWSSALLSGSVVASGCAPGTRVSHDYRANSVVLLAVDQVAPSPPDDALNTWQSLGQAISMDEVAPVQASAGWAFTNDAPGDKINWYFQQAWALPGPNVVYPASVNAEGFTLGNLASLSFELTGASNQVFVRVYTVPSSNAADNMASWYKGSWLAYLTNQGKQTSGTTSYTLTLGSGAGTLGGYQATSSTPNNFGFSLSTAPFSACTADAVLGISLQTNSIAPVNSNDFTIPGILISYAGSLSYYLDFTPSSVNAGTAVNGPASSSQYVKSLGMSAMQLVCGAFYGEAEQVVLDAACLDTIPLILVLSSYTLTDNQVISFGPGSSLDVAGFLTLPSDSTLCACGGSVTINSLQMSAGATLAVLATGGGTAPVRVSALANLAGKLNMELSIDVEFPEDGLAVLLAMFSSTVITGEFDSLNVSLVTPSISSRAGASASDRLRLVQAPADGQPEYTYNVTCNVAQLGGCYVFRNRQSVVPSPLNPRNRSREVVIGLAVGLSIAFVLIVGTIAVFVVRRNRQNSQFRLVAQTDTYATSDYGSTRATSSLASASKSASRTGGAYERSYASGGDDTSRLESASRTEPYASDDTSRLVSSASAAASASRTSASASASRVYEPSDAYLTSEDQSRSVAPSEQTSLLSANTYTLSDSNQLTTYTPDENVFNSNLSDA